MSPVRVDVSLRRQIHFHGFGVARQGPLITVEKVVVGPVGSPKHARTQAKTLQNRGFKPLNRGQKRSCGSFSTGCRALSTSVQYEKASSASQSPQHEASHGSVHQRLAGCTLTSLSSTLASLLRLS